MDATTQQNAANTIAAALGGDPIIVADGAHSAAPPNPATPEQPVVPATPATPPAQPAAAVPATPDAAPAQPTEPAAPAEPEPPKVAAPDPATMTPEERYLAALGAQPEAAPALDDNAKAALKARGIEDLDALLTESSTNKELVTQLRSKAEQYDVLEQRIAELPVEIGKAIASFRKGEDYTKDLLPLTRGISLNKEAKDIDRFALVDSRYPNRFTEDQKQSILDGTADETLKAAHDRFYELAINEHNAERGNMLKTRQAQLEAENLRREAMQRSTASAIAYAKKDPAVSALINSDVQSRFEKGTLIDELFYNEDGTYKPEGFALLTKMLNHDTVVARAMKGAAASAAVNGALSVVERLPEKPATTGGEIKQPTQKPQTPEEKYKSDAMNLVAEALMG